MIKYNNIRLILLLFAFLLLLMLTITGCGSSQPGPSTGAGGGKKPVVVKLAYEVDTKHPKAVWAADFQEIVNEKSAGQIKVEVYPSGQLYNSEPATFEAVTGGVIEITLPSSAHLAGFLPQYQVFDIPGFFPSDKVLYKFQDSEFGQGLLKEAEAKNVIGIGWANNAQLVTFSNKPIVNLGDFKGKKIRQHGSPALEASVKALGGNPVVIPAAELYMSMNQGVIDGFFSTITHGNTAKLYEVAKYVTDMNISPLVYPVFINKDFYNKLDENQKKIIKDAASAATKNNRDNLVANIEAAWKNVQSQKGVTINKLTKDQQDEWNKALKSVHDKMAPAIGTDWLGKAKLWVEQNK